MDETTISTLTAALDEMQTALNSNADPYPNQAQADLTAATGLLANYTPNSTTFNGSTDTDPCAIQKTTRRVAEAMRDAAQAIRDKTESDLAKAQAKNDAAEVLVAATNAIWEAANELESDCLNQ